MAKCNVPSDKSSQHTADSWGHAQPGKQPPWRSRSQPPPSEWPRPAQEQGSATSPRPARHELQPVRSRREVRSTRVGEEGESLPHSQIRSVHERETPENLQKLPVLINQLGQVSGHRSAHENQFLISSNKQAKNKIISFTIRSKRLKYLEIIYNSPRSAR